MQVVERHGGSNHYVRPDGVYRTSVLQPIQGYQPNQDVQAVAASFTERPMSIPLSGLGGFLGAAPTVGLLQRAKSWIQSRMASKGAGQFVALTTGPMTGPGSAQRPTGGPQGEQTSTEMIGRVQALAAMMGTNNPGFVGDQAVAFRRATAQATISNYNWAAFRKQYR
jgi:hypothetical protein